MENEAEARLWRLRDIWRPHDATTRAQSHMHFMNSVFCVHDCSQFRSKQAKWERFTFQIKYEHVFENLYPFLSCVSQLQEDMQEGRTDPTSDLSR